MNIKENILKRKSYLLIFIIFFAFFIFMNRPFADPASDFEKYNSEVPVSQTEVFSKNNSISQTFTAERDDLNKIGIRLITQDRKINSKINLKIKDSNNNKIIYQNELLLKDIKDDQYYYIDINRIKNSRDKKYEIIITSLTESEKDSPIFALAENNKDNKDEIFKYNNKEIQDKKLMLYFEYHSVNVIVFNYIVWITVFLLSIVFIIAGLDIANEKTFLKLALSFTILYVVIVPFPHYLDEGAHFFRSYMISKGNFYDKIGESGQIGGNVSKAYGNYVFQGMSLLKIANNSLAKGNLFDSKNEYFDSMKYFSSTVPTGHLIPAFGLFLGKIFRLNSGFSIYLARFFTYSFYVACSYFAIKNLKYYKSILFIIATLPITMYVAGSISLDPIINGCAFLFTSICLKYYFESDENTYISKKDIVLLIFTAIFIITNKYLTYTPLLLLFFLIPRNKFKTKKSYILLIITSIIIGIICVLWQFYMLKSFPYVEDRVSDVNQVEQIKFSLTHPIFVARILINHLEGILKIHSGIYTSKTFGTIPDLAGLAMLLGAIFENNKFYKDKKSKRLMIILFSIFVISILIAIYALYLSFTAVGDNHVGGYQLRYNIPLLLLFLIPIANLFKNKNEIKNYEEKLVFFMFILNLDAMLALIVEIFNGV